MLLFLPNTEVSAKTPHFFPFSFNFFVKLSFCKKCHKEKIKLFVHSFSHFTKQAFEENAAQNGNKTNDLQRLMKEVNIGIFEWRKFHRLVLSSIQKQSHSTGNEFSDLQNGSGRPFPASAQIGNLNKNKKINFANL